MSGLALPLAAEQLIPHRLPMRLVDRLLSVAGNSCTVAAQVGADCPLVDDDGLLEEVAMVELIAQSYAMLKGYQEQLEGASVRHGFLVGVKQVACHAAARTGDSLRIEIETLAELDDFAVAAGQVWRGEELLAAGEVKVWLQ